MTYFNATTLKFVKVFKGTARRNRASRLVLCQQSHNAAIPFSMSIYQGTSCPSSSMTAEAPLFWALLNSVYDTSLYKWLDGVLNQFTNPLVNPRPSGARVSVSKMSSRPHIPKSTKSALLLASYVAGRASGYISRYMLSVPRVMRDDIDLPS